MRKIAFILGLPFLMVSCSNEMDSANDAVPTKENKQNLQTANKTDDIPIYRFYNGRNHFYTTDYNEGANNGFSYEGILGYSVPGGLLVKRYYYAQKNDHYYTLGTAVTDPTNPWNVNWFFESYVFTAYDPSTPSGTKIYQYFNPTKVDHFYTSNYNELGAGGQGYNYEGVAFRLK